jgi:UDP-N-acetylmuramate dehydrogenase
MIESKQAPEWPCPALRDADLSAHTTARLGGRAEWLLEPTHPDQLVEAVRRARERGIEPRILGGGANLLIAEGVLRGVVITTARLSRVFRPQDPSVDPNLAGEDAFAPILPRLLGRPDPNLEPEREEDPRLIAWAGAGMPGLVRSTRLLGWSGFEGLVGVPGQLGGGIAMNAGGRWGDTWDVVESVRVLTQEGEVRDL